MAAAGGRNPAARNRTRPWHGVRSALLEVDLDRILRGACLALLPTAAVGVAVAGQQSSTSAPPIPVASSSPSASSSADEPAPEGAHDRARPAARSDPAGASLPDLGRAPVPKGRHPAPSDVGGARSSSADLGGASSWLARDLPVSPGAFGVNPERARRERKTSCGGLSVSLITASDDSSWSFATIAEAPGAAGEVYRVGDVVGRWKVAGIEWDRVLLDRGGSRCELAVHEEAPTHRAVAEEPDAMIERADAFAPLEDAQEAPERPSLEGILAAIHRVSPTQVTLTREALDAVFAESTRLLAGATFEPAIRDDEAGLQIEGVERSALLDRLGVRDGDVVLSLNGESCGTIESAIVALRRARSDERLVARVDRMGDVFDLDVQPR